MAGKQTIGQLLVELGMDTSDFKKGMSESEKVSRAGVESIGAAFGKIGDIATKAAAAIAGVGIAIGGAATAIGGQFEQQMAKVSAISQAGEEGLAALTQRARELGASTAFTATQAGEGMEQLARAGFSVNEIMNAIGPALNMAGAQGVELAQITTLMASNLKAFGLEASESARVADVFNKVTQESLFDVSHLTEAMKYVGPVARSMKIGLEEATAGAAMFRNMGLEGSMAGTAFRGAMVALVGPTDKAQKALKELGVEAEDVNPEIVGFEQAMLTLAEAGMTTEQAMAIFQRRFGGIAKAVADSMAETGDYAELLDELKTSAGSAEETYAEMMDTLTGQMAIFRSAMEEVALVIFQRLRDPVVAAMEVAARVTQRAGRQISIALDALGITGADLAEQIRGMEENLLELVDAAVRAIPQIKALFKSLVLIAGLAKGVQAVTMAIQGLPTALAAARGAMAAFNATATVTTGGLFAIATAAAAVVVALVEVVGNMREARDEAELIAAAQEAAAGVDEVRARKLETLNRILREQNEEMNEELRTSRELSEARRNEINTIQSLTAEEALRGVQQGTLIVNQGKLMTMEFARQQFGEDLVAVLDSQNEAERRRIETIKAKIAAEEENIKILSSLKPGIDDVVAVEEKLGTTLAESTKLLDFHKAMLSEAQEALDSRTKATAKAARANRDQRNSGENLLDTIEALKGASKDGGDAAKTAAEEAEAAWGAFKRGTEAAETWLEPAMNDIRNIPEEGVKSIEEWRKSIDELAKSMSEAVDPVRAEMTGLAHEITSGIIPALKEAGVAASKTVGDAAKGIASGVGGFVMGIAGQLMSLLQIPSLGDILDAGAANEDFAKSLEDKGMAEKAEAVRNRGGAAAATAGDQFAQAIIDAIGTIVEMVGPFVEAFVARIPDLISAVVEAIPVIVNTLVEQLPIAVQFIIDSLPTIIEALGDGIVSLVSVVPVLISAILGGLPTIILSLVNQVPKIVEELVTTLPLVVDELIKSLPSIVIALVQSIPILINALISALPSIYLEAALLSPRIVVALIGALPQLFVAIGEGLYDIAKQMAESFVEFVTLGVSKLFGKKGENGNKGFLGEIGDAFGSIFGGNFSGIDFVPHTMRGVTLHKGEAVIPAHENKRRRGGAGPGSMDVSAASAHGLGGGGAPSSAPVTAVFALDGRVVDGALHRQGRTGRSKTVQMMRKMSGTKVGVERGNFSWWSQ